MAVPGTLQIVLIALGSGLLVGSLAAWWITDSYKDVQLEAVQAEHVAQIETIRAEAATKLLDAERARYKIEGEMKDDRANLIEDHAQRIDDLSRTIADVSELVLRDPGYRDPGTSTADRDSSNAGSSDQGATGAGVLSTEATEFLWSFATEADGYLEDLRTAQRWEEIIQQAMKDYQIELEGDQADREM